MRLDKWLKNSRLIKRRTVANEACDAGKVTANARPVKASYEVKEGDILSLGEKTYLFRRVEAYYFGGQALYQWGLCVEKGVNDTWGTQS